MFELCFWPRMVSICHDVCVQVECAPKSAFSSLLAKANRHPSRIQPRSTVTGTAVATRPQLHATPNQNIKRLVALETDAVLHRNPLTLPVGYSPRQARRCLKRYTRAWLTSLCRCTSAGRARRDKCDDEIYHYPELWSRISSVSDRRKGVVLAAKRLPRAGSKDLSYEVSA